MKHDPNEQNARCPAGYLSCLKTEENQAAVSDFQGHTLIPVSRKRGNLSKMKHGISDVQILR